MIRVAITTGIVAATFAATPLSAQVKVTLGSETPRVCPDQPPQPEWVDNIPLREAHNKVLIQQMYRAQSMQAVAESGDCSCATRFPSWEAVETTFLEAYGSLDRWGATERTEEYRDLANENRKVAKPICEEQGNW
jgi:hypothetical protein